MPHLEYNGVRLYLHRHDPEAMRRALDLYRAEGPKAAWAETGIPERAVYEAARKAGVSCGPREAALKAVANRVPTLRYNGVPLYVHAYTPERVRLALDTYREHGKPEAVRVSGVCARSLLRWAKACGVSHGKRTATALHRNKTTVSGLRRTDERVRRLYAEHDRTLEEVAAITGKSVSFVQRRTAGMRDRSEAQLVLHHSPKRRSARERAARIAAVCRTVLDERNRRPHTKGYAAAARKHGVSAKTARAYWESDVNPYTAEYHEGPGYKRAA